jgi:gliding motility-associated protein GldC
MRKSSIQIDVTLDAQNLPETITWQTSDNPGEVNETKTFALSFWDEKEFGIRRIDLWTKDMFVLEMKQFFLQTMGAMNDTLRSATNDEDWYQEVEKTIQNLARMLQKEEAESNPK